MFELQPFLRGQLLELRPLRAEDFGDLYALERIGSVRVASRADAGGRDSYVYQMTASAFAARSASSRGGREEV